MATATENDLEAWEELNAERSVEQAASKDDIETKNDLEAKMSGVQETLSSLKIAIEGQADARGEGEKRSDETLKAILDEVKCLTEQNADVLKQNAAILTAMQEQTKVAREQSAVILALSSSLKGKESEDAVEGTSAARKQQAPAPAPAKEGLSVNATEGTCTWTIPNFSKLKVNVYGGKSSDIFSIGGHKWKLVVYPRGEGSEQDKSVSLFLQLADTNKLPKNGKVIAASTFSVICQHDPGKNCKERDGEPDIYSAKKKSWGCPDLIPLTDFHDAANGFLVNDRVIIEAKIEVKEAAPAKKVVSVHATSPLEGTCTWTISNFSTMKFFDEDGWKFSDTFSIGGHQWKLLVYPRGNGLAKDESISLYLHLADDTDKLPNNWQVTADFSLSVICQHNPEENHKEEANHKFNAEEEDWGWTKFISLTNLQDTANGFLVNDTVTFEVWIKVKSEEEFFDEPDDYSDWDSDSGYSD